MLQELPEKWCIELNSQEVVDYANKYGEMPPYKQANGVYAHFPKLEDSYTTTNTIKKGYTELTLEEFKLLVMKQDEKKIIGYKVPYDLFNGAITKGAIYKPLSSTKVTTYCATNNGHIVDEGKTNLPKEIVERWEAVYEEEFKKGDWIILTENYTNLKKGEMYKLISFQNGNTECWVVDHAGEDSYSAPYIYCFRKATQEEIKEYKNNLLLEEAKRRYPIGTKFYAAHLNKRSDRIFIVRSHELYRPSEFPMDISFICDRNDWTGNVYSNGKWAEIVPNHPQIEINGYKGEFFDNYVKFGCAEISADCFIDLYSFHNRSYKGQNKGIEYVTIGKGTFSKEQIEEIANYYTEKK